MAIEECCMLPVDLGYKRAREILRDLFGQEYAIARSLIDGLFEDSRPVAFNGDSLTHLAIKMQGCEIALSQMNSEGDLNALDTIERIVRVLPQPLQNSWAWLVDEGQQRPKFADLTNYILKEARMARSRFGAIALDNGSGYQKLLIDRNPDRRKYEPRSFAVTNKSNQIDTLCALCSGDH